MGNKNFKLNDFHEFQIVFSKRVMAAQICVRHLPKKENTMYQFNADSERISCLLHMEHFRLTNDVTQYLLFYLILSKMHQDSQCCSNVHLAGLSDFFLFHNPFVLCLWLKAFSFLVSCQPNVSEPAVHFTHGVVLMYSWFDMRLTHVRNTFDLIVWLIVTPVISDRRPGEWWWFSVSVIL
jgi:hypothetical protein